MPQPPALQLSQLPTLDPLFEIMFHPLVMLGAAVFALLLFGLMSIVLIHHWKTYSVNAARVKRAMIIYFSGGGVITVFIIIFGIIALAQ